jgi:hypothetical protein
MTLKSPPRIVQVPETTLLRGNDVTLELSGVFVQA